MLLLIARYAMALLETLVKCIAFDLEKNDDNKYTYSFTGHT